MRAVFVLVGSAGVDVEDLAPVVGGPRERDRLSHHARPDVIGRYAAPAEAVLVDRREPVLGPNRPVDELRESGRSRIRLVSCAHVDVEEEPVRGAVDQLGARNRRLRPESSADVVQSVVGPDAERKAVRERRPAIGAVVLVDAGQKAVDRAAAHLQNGIESPCQRVRDSSLLNDNGQPRNTRQPSDANRLGSRVSSAAVVHLHLS